MHLFYFFLSNMTFLEMNNVRRALCDSDFVLYHWFINNIISMKFDCDTDKPYKIVKNEILLAFPMFLFSLQYSCCYPIFYFLYFRIFVFDVS